MQGFRVSGLTTWKYNQYGVDWLVHTDTDFRISTAGTGLRGWPGRGWVARQGVGGQTGGGHYSHCLHNREHVLPGLSSCDFTKPQLASHKPPHK